MNYPEHFKENYWTYNEYKSDPDVDWVFTNRAWKEKECE